MPRERKSKIPKISGVGLVETRAVVHDPAIDDLVDEIFARQPNAPGPVNDSDDHDESEASIDAFASRDRDPEPHRSDAGNAERFVAKHKDRLRHCAPWGWMEWDGRRWRRDKTGVEIEAAKQIPPDIHAQAAAAHMRAAAGDESALALAKALSGFAIRSESGRSLREMAALARSNPAIAVTPDAFDQNPWLLNVMNGTIDLRDKGRLRPHDRADMISQLAPVEYDPAAECPNWIATMELMLPDPEVRLFWQRFLGYAMTGESREQVFVQMHGDGDNGKSTMITTVQTILGDYAVQSPNDLVILNQRGDDRGRRARAGLRGKRLSICAEIPEGASLDEPQIKALTGGDRVTGALLYENEVEFKSTAKIVINTNYRMKIRGTDSGIWRRVRVVPFNVQIPKERRDPTMPTKLLAEAPGILAWLVRGCLDWQANGLNEPAAIKQATATYRREEDQLADFLETFTEMDPDGAISTSHLYELSTRHAGGLFQSVNALTSRLARRGMTVTKRRVEGRCNPVSALVGYRLRSG